MKTKNKKSIVHERKCCVWPIETKKTKLVCPRQYSLVKFLFDQLPVEFHSRYPFVENGVYLFCGEIPNMPGHCVVADHKNGKIYAGYHTDNFVELTEEEV